MRRECHLFFLKLGVYNFIHKFDILVHLETDSCRGLQFPFNPSGSPNIYKYFISSIASSEPGRIALNIDFSTYWLCNTGQVMYSL